MSPTLSFFVLLALALVRATPIKDDTCNALAYPSSDCSASVSVSRSCHSATLDLTHSDFLKSCSSVGLFWSYPVHNLTLIIGTQHRQSYTVYVDNAPLMGTVSHVYRIINSQETEVTTHDEKLIQYSDSNHQVIIKLQGPSRVHSYGVFINYDIV